MLTLQKPTTNKQKITIKPPSLSDIKRIAKVKNATLVEYSILGNSLYIWLIQPTGKIVFQEINIQSLSTSFKKLIPQARKSLNVRSPITNQDKQETFAPGDLV